MTAIEAERLGAFAELAGLATDDAAAMTHTLTGPLGTTGLLII